MIIPPHSQIREARRRFFPLVIITWRTLGLYNTLSAATTVYYYYYYYLVFYVFCGGFFGQAFDFLLFVSSFPVPHLCKPLL